MLGLMQNRPLLISNVVDYVATWHAETEIVSRDPRGVTHRSNYGQVAARAERIANALAALGVGQGDRVATLAWNSWRHLEIYYGVTCSGRVLHTVNPRLFAEQLVYIVNHAENGYIFFDPDFTPLPVFGLVHKSLKRHQRLQHGFGRSHPSNPRPDPISRDALSPFVLEKGVHITPRASIGSIAVWVRQVLLDHAHRGSCDRRLQRCHGD